MTKNHKPTHNTKKATVLNHNKPKIKPIQILLAVSVVLVTGTIAFFMTQNIRQPTDSISTANAGTTQVTYPVSLFADGKAHHFDHKAEGMTIRYFILKSSDGVIRAAFDACDVCWPAGKGYYQDGDDMVCRNCGRRFASQLVNEVKGGCNPAPLNREVVGDRLVLKLEDIIQGKSYFNFKEKV